MAKVEQLRSEVLKAQLQIAERVNGDIQCSSYSQLRLEECLNALKKLEYFMSKHPVFKPYIRLIVVVSDEEIPLRVQSYQGDEATLAIREDFDYVSLASYGLLKGWLP